MNHLSDNQRTYFKHMSVALKFAGQCLLWTLQVAVHAFIPEAFPDTTGKMKDKLEEM